MPEISSNNIIAEVEFRFKARSLEEMQNAVGRLDDRILKLQKSAENLDKSGTQFKKLDTEIKKLVATKEKLDKETRIKINSEFNKRALDDGKIAVQALDKEIIQLQKDVLKLGRGSEEAAAKISKIGDLQRDRRNLTGAIGLGGTDQVQKGLGGITNSLGIAGKALGAFGIAFGAFQAVNFIRQSSEAAKEIENLAKSFEAFGIEEKKAFELANQIDNLAAKVPFQGEQINATAKNLLKFNISAKDLEPTILRLSAVSKGADFSLEALSDTFGRASQTGKVFGRDFLQVYKNIPGLVEAISKSTGKTIAETVKLGKAGKLSFEDFNKGIKAVTESTGKYGQVLSKYQATTEGASKAAKEAFGDIQEAFGKPLNEELGKSLKGLATDLKDLIPVAAFIGKVIGGLVSGIAALFKGIKQLTFDPLVKLFNFFKDNEFEIGGRGLIVKPIRKINEEVSQAVDETLANLSNRIENYGKAAVKKTGEATVELTEEQLAKIKEANKKFEDELKSFQEKLKGITFENSQIQLRLDGLDRIADQFQIIDEAKTKIKGLTDSFEKLKDIANQAGRSVSITIKEDLEAQIAAIAEEADRKIKELFAPVEVILPIEIKPVPTKALDFNIQKSKDEANDRIQNIFSGIVKVNLEYQTELKEKRKAEADFKSGFLAKLFGFDTPDQQAEFEKQLGIFTSKAIEAADIFIESQLRKTDFLISETEKRLGELLSIQEGGNVEQINLEQERLDKLNQQKQENLKIQAQINQAQILANNAITISNSISAITAAFAPPTGNLFTGIAASIALAATIAATVASLGSTLDSIPAFYEGVESVGSVKSGMKPVLNVQRDRYLVRVHEDERILTGDQNKKIPRNIPNDKIPTLVSKGIKYEETIENKIIKSTDLLNVRTTNFKTDRVSNIIEKSQMSMILKPELMPSMINNSFSIPKAEEMKLRPIVNVNIDMKEMSKAQAETNQLLKDLKKVNNGQSTTIKIFNNSRAKDLILKRMSK